MRSKLYIVLFFSCLTGSFVAAGQNLLPDGGFEQLNSEDCFDPDKGFFQTRFWYPLDATPDLFKTGCPYDEASVVFWDDGLRPKEGSHFAGLSSRWNSNGTYVSEGIATRLNKPLAAGSYFFELSIINRGAYKGLTNTVSGCDLSPDKHLELYLSEDSVRIVNNFSNGTSGTNATLVTSISSPDLQSDETGDQWMSYAGCFSATGGEQHLGILMPLGNFGELPLCASNASSGVFKSFYYHLDDLSLQFLPASMQREVSLCAGENKEINLLELLDHPLLQEAEFVWNDGVEGVVRVLSAAGTYGISAVLSCGTVAIELLVAERECGVAWYAPNAFSPNYDGQNDEFRLYLQDASAVTSFSLQVFDRWGTLIFESLDGTSAWDGTYRSRPVKEGVYLWLLSYELETLGGRKKYCEGGDVLLLR